MKNAPPSKPLPIVYLDDDPDEHLLLHRAMWTIRAPVRIWSVTTIEAAVESLSVTPAQRRRWQPIPAMILLDYQLQVTTSLALVCWIRSRLHLKRVPVVMFSNSDQPDTILRCFEAGADAFVCKPMGIGRLQEVVDALARCLQWHSLEPLTLLPEFRPPSQALPAPENPKTAETPFMISEPPALGKIMRG